MKLLLLVILLMGCSPFDKLNRDLDALNKQLDEQNDQLDHMLAEVRCMGMVDENIPLIQEIQQKLKVTIEEAYDVFVDACTLEEYKKISIKK